MRTFESMAELRDAVGVDLGVSGWVEVDQQRIDRFADATGDHQWIHVDLERAAVGPFGTTIAHGYLTLSLVAAFSADLLKVHGVRMAVNYGVNKVRFPSVVPVGSRVRGHGEIVEVTEVKDGVQIVCRITVEREGGDRPACVADTVVRFLGQG